MHDLKIKWRSLTLAAVLLWAIVPSARSGEGRIEISQNMIPMLISTGGSYVAVENLTDDGTEIAAIRVEADNVCIDLNGFMIKGVATSDSAIHQDSFYRNLIVRNGMILGFPQSNGVAASGANILIEDVRVEGCWAGFYAANNAIVADCIAVSNSPSGFGYEGTGFRMDFATVISDCIAYGNSDGFSALQGAVYLNCVATANQNGDGFSGWRDVVVANCVGRDNNSAGLLCQRAVVENSAFTRNRNGLDMQSYTIAANCALTENEVNGATVTSGFDAQLLTHNAAALNTNGMYAMNGSLITDCLAYSNKLSGLRTFGYTMIRNGLAVGQGWAGIYSVGNATRIDNNVVVSNNIGILVSGTDCLLVKNAFSGNNTNLDLAAGNITSWTTHTTNAWPWINYRY